MTHHLLIADYEENGGGRTLDVPKNRITAILHGQRSITADKALRPAHFVGTSAEFWINLQSIYDLRVALENVGDSLRSLPLLKRPGVATTGETSCAERTYH